MVFKPTVQGITLKGNNTNKQTKNKSRQHEINLNISKFRLACEAWGKNTKEIFLGLSKE